MSFPGALDEARRCISEGKRIGPRLAKNLLISSVDQGHLFQLGTLANEALNKWVGDKVYFVSNYHLYYTNVCVWQCRFCAFCEKPGGSRAYTKTLADIETELESLAPDISEVRVTGGINPALPLSYYLDLVSLIREKRPDVHIEAFAPTEIDYIGREYGIPARELLSRLKQLGLGSLTSGGAEIFNPRLRKKLCPKKTSICEWVRITKLAHELGISSNASILFGHFETHNDWLTHILLLRRIQDETHGFNSFIPLCYLPENSRLGINERVDFSEVLKMIAISRIVLDNFSSVKFLWIYYGPGQIAEALRFGVNDLAGTANETRKGVARSAGSQSPSSVSRDEMVDIIKTSGRIPVERGRLYEERHVYH